MVATVTTTQAPGDPVSPDPHPQRQRRAGVLLALLAVLVVLALVVTVLVQRARTAGETDTAAAPSARGPSATADELPVPDAPAPGPDGTVAPSVAWTLSAGTLPGAVPGLTSLAVAEPDAAGTVNASDVLVLVASARADSGDHAAEVLGVGRSDGRVVWRSSTPSGSLHTCHVLGDGSRVACLSQVRSTATTHVSVLETATGQVLGEGTVDGNIEMALAIGDELVLAGPAQSGAIAPVVVTRGTPADLTARWSVQVDSPELLESDYWDSISANEDTLVVTAASLVAVLDPASGSTISTSLGTGGAMPRTGAWVSSADGTYAIVIAADGTRETALPGAAWRRAVGSTAALTGIGAGALDPTTFDLLWTTTLPDGAQVRDAAVTDDVTVLWRTSVDGSPVAVTYVGVDGATGATLWEHEGTWAGTPWQVGAALVLDDNGAVWGLDLTDGSVPWSIDVAAANGGATSTVLGDVLVVAGAPAPGADADAVLSVTGYRFPADVQPAS
jgi:hypothetical protein